MNFTKNILLALFLTIFGFSTYADTKPETKKTESTQIQNYLEHVNFKEFISKDTKIIIHFTINDYNELVILSTNNEDLDGYIKNSLNDKKIELSKLQYNKEYDLPLVIKFK